MVSEAAVRKIVGVEGAEKLIKIIHGAWGSHQEEGRPRFRPTRAMVVHDYMVRLADEILVPMDGVERVAAGEWANYVLRGRVIVALKMHGRDHLTRNYPTHRQSVAHEEGQFEDMPGLSLLTAGYVLDTAEAGISEFVIVRRVAGRVEWVIDLDDLAAGNLTPVTDIIPGLRFMEEDIESLESIRSNGVW